MKLHHFIFQLFFTSSAPLSNFKRALYKYLIVTVIVIGMDGCYSPIGRTVLDGDISKLSRDLSEK